MRILGNNKIPLLSLIYCTCIVLYAGMATIFTRSLGDLTTVGNAVGLLLTFFVMTKHNIRLQKQFWNVMAVFLIYGMITTLNQGRFSPLWLTKWPILFLIAYVLCQDLKDKLLVTIETVIVALCIVSLVFWAVQVISPSTILRIVKQFEFSAPYSDEARIEANMLIFTINSNYDMDSLFGNFPRNAGFAWEAGAFGSYICIGLFCNLMRKEFKLKNNLPMIIMLVTLLTTQSTTAIGAFAFGIAIMLLCQERKSSFNIIWLIPLLLWITTLPFVSDKAMLEFEDAMGFTVSQIDQNRELTRMESLLVSWEEFQHHPILGLGGDAGGSWLIQQGYDVAIFSGIGELLSRYGIIMTILFFVMLFKSCRKMNEVYDKRIAYTFAAIMIGIMIGFNNWNAPIYMAFWLYCQFGWPLTGTVQGVQTKRIVTS